MFGVDLAIRPGPYSTKTLSSSSPRSGQRLPRSCCCFSMLRCRYVCWPGSVWRRASTSAVSAGCPATLPELAPEHVSQLSSAIRRQASRSWLAWTLSMVLETRRIGSPGWIGSSQ
jgi:hypothetical protein